MLHSLFFPKVMGKWDRCDMTEVFLESIKNSRNMEAGDIYQVILLFCYQGYQLVFLPLRIRWRNSLLWALDDEVPCSVEKWHEYLIAEELLVKDCQGKTTLHISGAKQ